VPCYAASVTLDDLLGRLRRALSLVPDLEYALLFGSAATRGPDAARDIDVAVALAHPFGLLERARLATELETAVGREVDLVDLDDASTLLRWEVVKNGRAILVNSPAALLALKARVPIERADLEPYLERESEGLRRALGKAPWSKSSSSATRSGS
jgi:predicted nucleotidyltransferase